MIACYFIRLDEQFFFGHGRNIFPAKMAAPPPRTNWLAHIPMLVRARMWYRYTDRTWHGWRASVTHGDRIFCTSTVASTPIRMSSSCDLSAKSCALTTSSCPANGQAGITLFQTPSTTESWFPSRERDSGSTAWCCIFSILSDQLQI